MELKLKKKPEDIAEIETRRTIRMFWRNILNGEDVNPSIAEWQEVVEDQYVQISHESNYWSGSEEMQLYEFVKRIAQMCRARMNTKLEAISKQLNHIKAQFTDELGKSRLD